MSAQRLSFPPHLRRALVRLSSVLVGIVLMVLIVAWLSGAFEPKIAPGHDEEHWVRAPAEAATEEVHEVTKEYFEEAVGTLKAASRAVISAKVLATIESITVSAGDQVEAGQELVRLDSSELEARLRQAEQSLAAAIANRRDADAGYERDRRLVEQRSVSRAEFDESTRRLEVAKADELRAEQAVNEASVQVSYTRILAPKAGRIVDRLAEPGDTARPGEPLLMLYDASSLRLEAPIREQLAVQLHVGDLLPVSLDALRREVTGTVDEIVPQADAPSRSFLVKVRLPTSDDLYEEMFGRLKIPAGTRRHLCLATDAIRRIGQLEFVDVVGPDRRIERRMIKTGRLGMPGRVEVLSGLNAGERVLLRPSRP